MMKTQVKRISIHQSSKVTAILYTIIAFIIGLVLALQLAYNEQYLLAIVTLILSPIFYGLFGYIISAIVYWLYNGIAKRFGGMEFTFSPVEEETEKDR